MAIGLPRCRYYLDYPQRCSKGEGTTMRGQQGTWWEVRYIDGHSSHGESGQGAHSRPGGSTIEQMSGPKGYGSSGQRCQMHLEALR